MLPRATTERNIARPPRARSAGERTRSRAWSAGSLRGVVDMAKLGERTITVDCDVINADAAPAPPRSRAAGSPWRRPSPRTDGALASSAAWPPSASGFWAGMICLDLDYSEDSKADVDFIIVATDAGRYVELQGTAEGKPFERADVDRMLDHGGRRVGAPFCRPGRGARLGQSASKPGAGEGSSHGGRDGSVAACSLRPGRRIHSCASCRDLLGPLSTRLVSLDDAGIPGERDRDGDTSKSNAAKKACASSPAFPGLTDPGQPTTPVSRSDGPRRRTRVSERGRYAARTRPTREKQRQAAPRAGGPAAGATGGALPARPGRWHSPRPQGPGAGVPGASRTELWRAGIAAEPAATGARIRPDLRAGGRAAPAAGPREWTPRQERHLPRGRAARRMHAILAELGF